MKSKIVFVIEDERDIAELIRFNLNLIGCEVEVFYSGEPAFQRLLTQLPDLFLVDIMLPGMNGIEICKKIKTDPQSENIPVIMVSARGEENDIVRGLEIGADDYITKPFSTAVLNARVEAVIRRGRPKTVPEVAKVQMNGIEIDVGRVEVKINGAKVDLTQSEFKILQFLAQRPGWVFTRGQIVEAIRGENYAVTDRTIDFQMVGLRKKMGAMGDCIETVRGVGYRFKESQ